MTAPGRWPRHALITGASHGLGLELATLLAQAGTRLVVTARGDAAHGGWPGWGVYGAGKAAFELAGRTLAAEAPELVPVDATVDATVLAPNPGLRRLRFLRTDGEPAATAPVRYGHLRVQPPVQAYATVFGDRPGSAEMASAGRPFTAWLLRAVRARGVELARVTLHAGVSSLDAPDDAAQLIVPAETFEVDAATVRAVNDALGEGRRVVAIGTGAVPALESAWDGRAVRPVRGWTRRVLAPGRSGRFLSGLITGLHGGSEASHLRLLQAVLGTERVQQAYCAAAAEDLLAHEFGDLQLLWR